MTLSTVPAPQSPPPLPPQQNILTVVEGPKDKFLLFFKFSHNEIFLPARSHVAMLVFILLFVLKRSSHFSYFFHFPAVRWWWFCSKSLLSYKTCSVSGSTTLKLWRWVADVCNQTCDFRMTPMNRNGAPSEVVEWQDSWPLVLPRLCAPSLRSQWRPWHTTLPPWFLS